MTRVIRVAAVEELLLVEAIPVPAGEIPVPAGEIPVPAIQEAAAITPMIIATTAVGTAGTTVSSEI